jgi:hypothetical protein
LRRIRRIKLAAGIAALAALALLAQAYRVDNRDRAAQQDAEAHGMTAPAVVEVSLGGNEQNRTDLMVDVAGVKRTAKIFDPSHPIVRGMALQVAWTPDDPARIYIVGERPWTWWAAMRPLFAAIAVVAVATLLAGLWVDLGRRAPAADNR